MAFDEKGCNGSDSIATDPDTEKDENDGEITIYKIPNNLILILSDLNENKINTVSPLWAETEELEWETEEAQEVIESLVKLSKKSISGNKGLYLWNCV